MCREIHSKSANRVQRTQIQFHCRDAGIPGLSNNRAHRLARFRMVATGDDHMPLRRRGCDCASTLVTQSAVATSNYRGWHLSYKNALRLLEMYRSPSPSASPTESCGRGEKSQPDGRRPAGGYSAELRKGCRPFSHCRRPSCTCPLRTRPRRYRRCTAWSLARWCRCADSRRTTSGYPRRCPCGF